MKSAIAFICLAMSFAPLANASASADQNPMPARCTVWNLKSGNATESTSPLYDFKLRDIGHGLKTDKQTVQLSKNIALEITLSHRNETQSPESWQQFDLAAQMIEQDKNGKKKVIAHFSEEAQYEASNKREIKATIYNPDSSTFLLDKKMNVENYKQLMVDMQSAGIEIVGAEVTCFHW